VATFKIQFNCYVAMASTSTFVFTKMYIYCSVAVYS